MLKTCSYCGRIHDINQSCPHKIKYTNTDSDIRCFRNTELWHKKREQIKRRDRYMCVACYRNLTGTVNRYNTHNLSVHHLIPLVRDFDKRLDDDNLVTLCRKHHEMAEDGLLNVDELRVSPGG